MLPPTSIVANNWCVLVFTSEQCFPFSLFNSFIYLRNPKYFLAKRLIQHICYLLGQQFFFIFSLMNGIKNGFNENEKPF